MTTVENADFLKFAERIIKRAGVRLAEHPDDLADLIRLADTLNQATTAAIAGAHDAGMSWAELAALTGTSRQAVQQRAARAAGARVQPLEATGSDSPLPFPTH